jgi:superfamily II DNA or RNA helicase
MNYDKVKFKGKFRDYQSYVLQSVEKHNQDKKIHIVAPPGSGKTILGLELIRYLGKPALILSPSITIRQQWGSRFFENFLDETESKSDYFSFDLTQPKLITCVTYQALHAALNKLVKPYEEDDSEYYDKSQTVQEQNFHAFDLLAMIKHAGIQTICLDEAHHLRSEWQKSLEIFLDSMKLEINIIALTATPPYDSTPQEWERYIKVCGEIDEEISTPLLVAQGTLCPHQDYVYFNYPTETEMNVLYEYYSRIDQCLEEILSGSIIDDSVMTSKMLIRNDTTDQMILDYPKEFVAIMSLIKISGGQLPKSVVKLVSSADKLPTFDIAQAEAAFNFIISHPEIFGEINSTSLNDIVSSYHLIERKRVNFTVSEKVSRAIISSVGKLMSIAQIVLSEYESMKSSLRMLILTDYIKKDMLGIISDGMPIETIGTVPIFETLRRQNIKNLKIAVLSGSLVIVPNEILKQLRNLSEQLSIDFSIKPIKNCEHSELLFTGSNKSKVKIMTEAFQNGWIEVLIGTKSLLGEGWDSPCINSMILASFVGTFVISNQMRGRAIRIDPQQPNKTANIWHLVTIEPTHLLTQHRLRKFASMILPNNHVAKGVDFELMIRRFKTFYAPSYEEDTIESGIERCTAIKPPFTLKNIGLINEQMLALSNNRSELIEQWKGILKDDPLPQIIEINEIPKKVTPINFIFINLLNSSILILFSQIFHQFAGRVFFQSASLPSMVLGIVLFIVNIAFFNLVLVRILRFISPYKTIKTLGNCILRTLVDLGEIKSRKAKFVVQPKDSDEILKCALVDGTTYEKTIFARSMSELLTSIENPRYLLIKQYRILFFKLNDFGQSYACPSIIASKKENVEIFEEHLQNQAGKFSVQFTRSEKGRKVLLKCRRKSYINRNEIFIKGKKIIKSKWE